MIRSRMAVAAVSVHRLVQGKSAPSQDRSQGYCRGHDRARPGGGYRYLLHRALARGMFREDTRTHSPTAPLTAPTSTCGGMSFSTRPVGFMQYADKYDQAADRLDAAGHSDQGREGSRKKPAELRRKAALFPKNQVRRPLASFLSRKRITAF